MSIKFFVKIGGHWTEIQEYCGRDGMYTYYPYYYCEYPIRQIPTYSYDIKVVITDNIHTVTKIFN